MAAIPKYSYILQIFYFANRYFLLFALIGMYVTPCFWPTYEAQHYLIIEQSCRVERDERGQLPGLIHVQPSLR